MRFTRDHSPSPYLNRKDQFRLIGLVGMLTLIVISINFTSKAENWAWFFAIAESKTETQLRELKLDDLDFRINPPLERSLKSDEFLAVAQTASRPDPHEFEFDIAQIPQELLVGVEDRRVGLLRSEQSAMELALKRVRTLSPAKLESAAAENFGFRVIFTDSETHRGKLFKLEGKLWRLQRFPFGDPNSKDDDLWQAWLFSSDSGNNPWVVLSTEKPPGIEPGEEINRDISLAGYFFKNYGYATDTGLHLAPLFIARTFRLQPLPEVQNDTQDLSLYVVGCLLVVGFFFGILIWWFKRSDRKFERSHLAEIAESRLDAPPEFVVHLNELDAHEPDEFFKQLNDAPDA